MMTEFKRTNTKRPMMFIRRFTDKKLSTYIRTSQMG